MLDGNILVSSLQICLKSFDGHNGSLICDLASNESLNPSFLHCVLCIISFSFGDCFIFDTAMQLFG